MPTVDDQVAEWKHAYQVLGVPHYASAHVIKAAYRKLVKRWHPDLYAAGTSEHADATQMSMLINQAHSAIANAPLRYTSNSPVFNQTPQRGDVPSGSTINIRIDAFRPHRADRLEFWVRFVCGALFGIVSGVAWVLSEMATTSNGISDHRRLRCHGPDGRLRLGGGSIRRQVLVFGPTW